MFLSAPPPFPCFSSLLACLLFFILSSSLCSCRFLDPPPASCVLFLYVVSFSNFLFSVLMSSAFYLHWPYTTGWEFPVTCQLLYSSRLSAFSIFPSSLCLHCCLDPPALKHLVCWPTLCFSSWLSLVLVHLIFNLFVLPSWVCILFVICIYVILHIITNIITPCL